MVGFRSNKEKMEVTMNSLAFSFYSGCFSFKLPHTGYYYWVMAKVSSLFADETFPFLGRSWRLLPGYGEDAHLIRRVYFNKFWYRKISKPLQFANDTSVFVFRISGSQNFTTFYSFPWSRFFAVMVSWYNTCFSFIILVSGFHCLTTEILGWLPFRVSYIYSLQIIRVFRAFSRMLLWIVKERNIWILSLKFVESTCI